jgi:predicted nucleotidyltransferase
VITISEFETQLASLLPTTHEILMSSNLTVHPSVTRIILHGSRGPADKYRPDSDIDLSLTVEPQTGMIQLELEDLLHDVFDMTKSHWHGSVDVDLAVAFDVRNCGLNCFEHTIWDDGICQQGGMDCFGLYKIGKGFNGLVTNAGIQVKLMYPCLKIWQRARTGL